MLEVVLHGGAVNDNVVDVHFAEGSVLCQNAIHRPLECCRSITRAERHYLELKGSEFGTERRSFDIRRDYLDLVVTLLEIQFGEDSGMGHFVEKFVDSREWVLVLLGDLVQSPVVNAKTERAVFLPCKEDSGAEWRAGRLDLSGGQVLVQLGTELPFLCRRHAINPMVWGLGVREEINTMVRSGTFDRKAIRNGVREDVRELLK